MSQVLDRDLDRDIVAPSSWTSFGEDVFGGLSLPSPASEVDGGGGSADYIFRLVANSSSAFVVAAFSPTELIARQLSDAFLSLHKDIDSLRGVVDWQARNLDYQALQNAHALGAMTDEEFDEEAERFIQDIGQIEPDLLCDELARLERLLPSKLTISDFADYFGVDSEDFSRFYASKYQLLKP